MEHIYTKTTVTFFYSLFQEEEIMKCSSSRTHCSKISNHYLESLLRFHLGSFLSLTTREDNSSPNSALCCIIKNWKTYVWSIVVQPCFVKKESSIMTIQGLWCCFLQNYHQKTFINTMIHLHINSLNQKYHPPFIQSHMIE